jgi:16S rRNA (cytosine967-C5)-methyltransferase
LADPRAVAARLVHGVAHEGRSLDALTARLGPDPFATQLAFQTLRFHRGLDRWVRTFLQRPPKGRRLLLHALLLCGARELSEGRRPAFAVVDETVTAAQRLGLGGARGFVNAVLRRLAADPVAPETLAGPPSHPPWLLEALRESWGDRADAVARANDRPGAMTLRVNLARTDRASARQNLEAAGHPCTPTAAAPAGLVLHQPAPVGALPGFAEGLLSVQDESAQLAVELLLAALGDRTAPPERTGAPVPADASGPRLRVLDACAGPGGKTGHLGERLPGADLVAVEADAARTRPVQETLVRLGLRADVRTADATAPATWWDRTPFDTILLDAPCSGTGVIRRHPDIKLLRRDSDVPALAVRQRALLDALWPLLAPGGCLLYTTCSILRPENEGVIGPFLEATPDATDTTPVVPWAEPASQGRVRPPGAGAPPDFAGDPERDAGGDGFYYCVLHKAEAS